MYQQTLDPSMGPARRVVSWEKIFVAMLREVGVPEDGSKEAEEKFNKAIVAAVVSDIPQVDGLVEAIANCYPDRELCKEAVRRFLLDPSVPPLETIARNLRKAKEYLADRGELRPGWKSREVGNLEDLAEEFAGNKRTVEKELQSRFYRALQEAFLHLDWEWESWYTMADTPLQGRNKEFDIVCEKLKLAIEVDGYVYHNDEEAFCTDRQKSRSMVAKGWTVLQFSGSELSITGGIGIAVEEVGRHVNRLSPLGIFEEFTL